MAAAFRHNYRLICVARVITTNYPDGWALWTHWCHWTSATVPECGLLKTNLLILEPLGDGLGWTRAQIVGRKELSLKMCWGNLKRASGYTPVERGQTGSVAMVTALSMLIRITLGKEDFNTHDSSQSMVYRRGVNGHPTYWRGIDLNDCGLCLCGRRDVWGGGRLWVLGGRVFLTLCVCVCVCVCVFKTTQGILCFLPSSNLRASSILFYMYSVCLHMGLQRHYTV